MKHHRRSIPKGKSKRMFRKSAAHTHKKNMPRRLPMRGGIRL